MKYCSHCGNELLDEAVVCPRCGCRVESQRVNVDRNDLFLVIKIFMIIGCVVISLSTLFIGLAWTLPMTLSACRRLDKREPIGVGFKVCTLLFVNLVAGILLLCADTENYIG